MASSRTVTTSYVSKGVESSCTSSFSALASLRGACFSNACTQHIRRGQSGLCDLIVPRTLKGMTYGPSDAPGKAPQAMHSLQMSMEIYCLFKPCIRQPSLCVSGTASATKPQPHAWKLTQQSCKNILESLPVAAEASVSLSICKHFGYLTHMLLSKDAEAHKPLHTNAKINAPASGHCLHLL